MSRPKKEKRVIVERPQFPEPLDAGGFELYLLEKGIVGYLPECKCYACNSNRQYFTEHWSIVPLAHGATG